MLIDAVMDYTVATRWSDASTSNRTASIRAIKDFREVTSVMEAKDVTQLHVAKWVQALQANGLKSSTINARLMALSAVMTDALTLDAIEKPFKVVRLKTSGGRVRVLSATEERQMLTLFARLNTEQAHVARHITIFLVDTGLRISEFFALRDEDVTDDSVTIWNGKGGKPRTVPLTQRASRAWGCIQSSHKEVHTAAYRELWQDVRVKMMKVGDKEFVPHMLRHTCASRLAAAGVSLGVIQKWLGHADIQTTMRYVHFAPTDFDNACKALENFK